MKNKLNVGVIGLGVGAKHAHALHLNKKVNLVSLCDFDNKKINIYKKIYKNCDFTNNSDDIFKNPTIDIVSIASYDNFHAKHILQAIKYKKHFFNVSSKYKLIYFDNNNSLIRWIIKINNCSMLHTVL